jgi:hypothetical protein
MGYIVDLTLIMDQLFLNTLALKPPHLLSKDQVDIAVDSYKSSEAQRVHRQIRDYANRSTFPQILKSNNAQEEVKRLIRQYSSLGGTKVPES